jgi:hypothetical protein
MPQIKHRQLSPGELANLKRLQALEAVRQSKLRPGHAPNSNIIYKPFVGAYGELLNWAAEND